MISERSAYGPIFYTYTDLYLNQLEQSHWFDNPEDEIRKCKSRLKVQPNLIEMRFKLAILMQQDGDRSVSIQIYNEILDHDPQNIEALNRLAVSYLMLYSNVNAEETFQRVLDIDPQNEFALLHICFIYQREVEKKKLRETAERCIAVNPGMSYAWYFRGWVEMFGDHTKCKDYYEKAIELDENNICALEELGLYYEQVKDYKKACIYLERLETLLPEMPCVLSLLGEMQVEARYIDKAVQTFRTLFVNDPKSFNALEHLIYLHALKGEIQECKKYIRHTLEFEPQYYDGYVWIWYHENISSKRKNLNALKKLHMTVPDSWYVLQSLGRVYNDNKHFDIALNFFTNLVEMLPEYAGGWMHLVIVQLKSDRLEEAKFNVRRLLEIDAHELSILSDIGELFIKKQCYFDAIFVFETLLAIYPASDNLWYHLGIAQHHNGMYEDAERSYLKALELDNQKYSRNRIMHYLVVLYGSQEKWKEAFRYAEKLTKIAPHYVQGWNLLAEIYENFGDQAKAKLCEEMATRCQN
ncbi:MAG: tetratricopeptide repeat protein [Bacteroidales bacterium]|nr:tetratricopeptide repeat protein [Bacteroidales bacterium]